VAFIGLRVPHDAARLLEAIEVPGERLSASDMHITILYLGKNVPVIQIAKAMVVAAQATSQQVPFNIMLSNINSFPRNAEDGYPIICPVDSPELHSFRNSLKESFQKYRVPFVDNWPEFKPHITLSYLKDVEEDTDFKLDQPLPGPLSFTALELTIWGGDKGDGKIHVGLPFVLSPIARAAARVAKIRSQY
jgi:2'-5' RNA ligase